MKAMHAFALSILVASSPALADVKDDVAGTTKAWADAMSAHDMEKVVSFYDPEAVLWGTRSPTLRADPARVRDYFTLLKTVPPSYKATIVEQNVRVFGDIAVNTGRYTFSQEENGKEVLRPSRFSMVFRKSGDRWLIVDHHSSAVPEAAK